jgi:hypothetical protein
MTRRSTLQRPIRLRTTRTLSTMHGFSSRREYEEERKHRAATRRPGPLFYSGAYMRAPLYERLSSPRATSPGARSSRRFTRPRRRQSRLRSSASLSGPGAFRRLIILNMDGTFCAALRRANSRPCLATGFFGRCTCGRTLSIFQDPSLHGRLRMRLSVIAWLSAQLLPLASTTDACEGDEKDRPRDSSGLDDADWDYCACVGYVTRSCLQWYFATSESHPFRPLHALNLSHPSPPTSPFSSPPSARSTLLRDKSVAQAVRQLQDHFFLRSHDTQLRATVRCWLDGRRGGPAHGSPAASSGVPLAAPVCAHV